MSLSHYIGFRYAGAKRRNQLVSFLSAMSIAGLTIGVALLICVLSIMNGFERELKEKILGLVPQAASYQQDGMKDWQQVQQKIQDNPGVIASSPFVQVHALANRKNFTSPLLLYGFSPEHERGVSLISDYLSQDTLNRIANDEAVIVLGKGIAAHLQAKVGDKVMVVAPKEGKQRSPAFANFTLIEIITSQTELDTTLALSSLNRAASLSSHPEAVSGLRLKVKDLFLASRTVYELLVELGPGYFGNNWTRTHGNLYSAIRMSKNLVGLLMTLLVAIAAFNVVSTLVMVVVDKKGDIAILRTLGMTTKEIMKIFIVQGFAIGIIGTFFGIVFGLLLALGMEQLVQFIESLFSVQFLKSDVYPLTYLPTEIQWADILQVVAITLSLSFLATLYPAYRASKVEPAQALRYE